MSGSPAEQSSWSARWRRAFSGLRLSRPWSFKAPFLIAVPYTVIALLAIPWAVAVQAILASVVTILGIAGGAYLLNDLADREADARAGKPNFAAGRSPGALALWGVFFAALALLPWGAVLPLTATTGALLGFELALFAAYSLPPLRLKNRGGLGAAADALYAHAVPAVLAASTFAALANAPVPSRILVFVTCLGVWQLLLGLRNILLHQLEDLEADQAAGLRTWVTGLGRARAESGLRRIVVPAELVFFAATLAIVAREVSTLLPGLVVFVLFTSALIRFRWRRPLPRDLRGFLFNYVDDFTGEWIPILVLLELCTRDRAFVVLLVLHVALFPKNAVLRIWREARAAVTT